MRPWKYVTKLFIPDASKFIPQIKENPVHIYLGFLVLIIFFARV